MDTSKDEAHWVLRAQCGDRDALECLLRAALPALRRYAARLVGPAHADDVSQNVLITISQKIQWLREPALFRPWLFRIASRAAIRYLKSERRWSDQIRDPALLDMLPAEPIVHRELVGEVLERGNLSPASRAVLSLHFEEGFTLAEVAAILEIPLGTVKSRLAYGLVTLREHISTRSVS